MGSEERGAAEPAAGEPQVPATEIVRIPLGGADGSAALATALEAAQRDGGYLAAPHCAGVLAFASEAPAEAIVVVSWASRDAHDEAAAGPSAGAFFAAVGEAAAGPPSVGWYDELS